MTALKSVLAALALACAAPLAAQAARADLVLGVILEPPHLDPTAGAAAAIDEIVYANVFEGLTRIGPDGAAHPGLAESWTVSGDGKVYTFKLRTGVKFHDGTDFDAADVKFSLDRARAADSTNAQKGLFSGIASVDVIGPATVKVTLTEPQGLFPTSMAWGDAVIVAPESAATNKEKPVGTGPFRFGSWARGASITLVKSDDYWGTPVHLDKAEFRVVPDAAAAVPAMLSGDVQAFPFFPPDGVGQLGEDPRFHVAVGSTEGETILAINNRKPPFDKLAVRQAVSHALDRKAIIDGGSNGYGEPIGSFFPPNNPAYIDLTQTYPYDVEDAKHLLAEAGFPDGFRTTLKLPPTPYALLGGEIVAAQLRDIGIEAAIIPVQWPEWLSQVFTDKDYDLTIVSHTEPNDLDIFARKDYYFGYDNSEFDRIIADLRVTMDPQARKALYARAQKILADDAAAGFLFELPKVGVWDARLQGLWENAPIQANDLTQVRWVD